MSIKFSFNPKHIIWFTNNTRDNLSLLEATLVCLTCYYSHQHREFLSGAFILKSPPETLLFLSLAWHRFTAPTCSSQAAATFSTVSSPCGSGKPLRSVLHISVKSFYVLYPLKSWEKSRGRHKRWELRQGALLAELWPPLQRVLCEVGWAYLQAGPVWAVYTLPRD